MKISEYAWAIAWGLNENCIDSRLNEGIQEVTPAQSRYNNTLAPEVSGVIVANVVGVEDVAVLEDGASIPSYATMFVHVTVTDVLVQELFGNMEVNESTVVNVGGRHRRTSVGLPELT